MFATIALMNAKSMTTKLYLVLFSRIGLVLGIQLIIALFFYLFGVKNSWRMAADWWVAGLTLANILGLVIVTYSLKNESLNLRSLWELSKIKTEKAKDIQWFFLAAIVSMPLAMLPNLLIGTALWGSSQIGADMMFRALPLWGAIAILLIFPITQGLAELTLYFGYVMPRLERYLKNSIWPLVICSSVLALQHVFMPLLFDWKFIAWRALMFLPFAFWVGFVIQRRPRTLPYMMVLHAFIDVSIPIMILVASV
jgi:hypothetical protein